jgi:preprotein translocase subunit SecG
MMENGRKLINEAERSYKEASEKAFSKTVSDYLNPLSNGRSSFSEGLSLFSRQDTASPDDFLVKLILVLLPLVVCILIGLSIMSQKGPKNPLKNNLSKTKVKAGEESTIERRLEIANPESIQLFVKVADFPPQILSASDFSLEPARKANNAILWELNLKPKEKLSIRYKLKGTMQPGTINFPACSALFALEDGQRKFVGTSSKIDIK